MTTPLCPACAEGRGCIFPNPCRPPDPGAPPTPRNIAPPGIDSVSRADRFRIAASAHADPVTVANYLKGKRIQPSTRLRIEAAARELEISLPVYKEKGK